MHIKGTLPFLLWLSSIGAAPPSVAPPPTNTPVRPSPCVQTCITDEEALKWATAVSPKGGITGTFAFIVGSGTSRGQQYYLYSGGNAYDCDCLTVILPASVTRQLAGSGSIDQLGRRFVSKWIVVKGTAYRKHVEVLNIDKPTGKYHDPIELEISDPADISVH